MRMSFTKNQLGISSFLKLRKRTKIVQRMKYNVIIIWKSLPYFSIVEVENVYSKYAMKNNMRNKI